MRLTILLAAAVAVLVGAVGLLAPVSLSPGLPVVSCGSAVSPDLSAARSLDDGNAANIPVPGGVAVDVSYAELCRMDLEDRRLWTLPLIGAGILAAALTAIASAQTRRRRRRSADTGTAPTG
jgi:hypothetical protein